MVFIGIKDALKNIKEIFDDDLKNKTTSTEIIIAGIFLLCVLVAIGFYFLGNSGVCYGEEKQPVEKVEEYMILMQQIYGLNDTEDVFKQRLGIPNIPNKLYQRNITLMEAIDVYFQYQFVASSVAGIVLEDICK